MCANYYYSCSFLSSSDYLQHFAPDSFNIPAKMSSRFLCFKVRFIKLKIHIKIQLWLQFALSALPHHAACWTCSQVESGFTNRDVVLQEAQSRQTPQSIHSIMFSNYSHEQYISLTFTNQCLSRHIMAVYPSVTLAVSIITKSACSLQLAQSVLNQLLLENKQWFGVFLFFQY